MYVLFVYNMFWQETFLGVYLPLFFNSIQYYNI